MHRRPAHKQHGGLWEFPGGKVEPDETPVSALVRELEEELDIGVEPASLRPIAFAQNPPGPEDNGIVILLYSVTDWRGEPRPLEQGAAVDWFTATELATLERPPLDVTLCTQIFLGNAERGVAG